MPHYDNNSQSAPTPFSQWVDDFPPLNLWNFPDMQTKQTDLVNDPPHYKQGSIECIDAIKAALTPEEFLGYCKGNIMKYMWRERYKGGVESRRKAAWYLKQVTND